MSIPGEEQNEIDYKVTYTYNTNGDFIVINLDSDGIPVYSVWEQEVVSPYSEEELNEWQVCPVCTGEGRAAVLHIPTDGTSVTWDNGYMYSPCHKCFGSCIISKIDGKPPRE